ncbi:hypothetical protein F53441_10656 [Fusarium austroafricanum]|uniref:DUF985 domain-containing protein n=1 Tax=Fusarium austroafricanum TaxID=2364996 RepID=A0A8H4P1Z4_9HYPO|nr:hypothetical protein F53441_10656 [Fusarium austroafricanum]
MRFGTLLPLLPLSLALHLPETLETRTKHGKPIKECSAEQVIDLLKLEASTEKGYFVQTFQDPMKVPGTNRSISTAIYYLLEGREGQSLWHTLDAAEVWHYYAGAPLVLSLSHNDGSCTRDHVMGNDLYKGQRPQVVIAKDEWQSARSLGDWTLVGTTVAPGFEVAGQDDQNFQKTDSFQGVKEGAPCLDDRFKTGV